MILEITTPERCDEPCSPKQVAPTPRIWMKNAMDRSEYPALSTKSQSAGIHRGGRCVALSWKFTWRGKYYCLKRVPIARVRSETSDMLNISAEKFLRLAACARPDESDDLDGFHMG